MTSEEFFNLLKFLEENHRFGKSGKMIKYVHPTFDLRDGHVFHVKFVGFFEPLEGISFDFRDNEKSMLQNIYDWLGEQYVG